MLNAKKPEDATAVIKAVRAKPLLSSNVNCRKEFGTDRQFSVVFYCPSNYLSFNGDADPKQPLIVGPLAVPAS